ncbi:hypothetical protein RFI_09918 [Reticulomyxa filosa]|uniref:Ion transport domain-containing protein n=1 Tax=Reticulomyxa filosa TaxID=46433 RepID=X6NPB4_RETFI|nr:hypothetical protein RFI_09918 [Reticulomyxa filosa]|eukprot:ETO27212.1 hypothetical protein RFI_09918 [Reticulomyxa filosa]
MAKKPELLPKQTSFDVGSLLDSVLDKEDHVDDILDDVMNNDLAGLDGEDSNEEQEKPGKRKSEDLIDNMMGQIELQVPGKKPDNQALNLKSDTERIDDLLDIGDDGDIDMSVEQSANDPAGPGPDEKGNMEEKGQEKDERPKQKEKTVADTKEAQNIIDEAVIKLLHPDLFNQDKIARREWLRRNEEKLRTWPVNPIDEKIINVADCMSTIDRLPMVDAGVLNRFDVPSAVKEYKLKRIDLQEIPDIPKKYFEQTNTKEEDSKSGRSGSIVEFVIGDSEEGSGLGAIGGLSGKFDALTALGNQDKSEKPISCSGCGVRLKFKKKTREKDCFMAYKCDKTNKHYIFHDYLCVKLRIMKEAIRQYVFKMEVPSNASMDKDTLEGALIGIDVDDGGLKRSNRAKPQNFTTPRRGDFNYVEELDNKEIEEVEEESKERKTKRQLSTKRSTASTIHREEKKEVTTENIRFESFRRYRSHVTMIMERLETEPYEERFGKLPKVVLYCDLNEFGVALWEFVSESLKSKFRLSLWRVLEFLALEMGVSKVLDLFNAHTYLMAKHTLEEFDKVVKAAIEGSRYPIASSLRMAAFMNYRAKFDLSNEEDFIEIGKNYEEIAKKLLKEIESDHLFAMLVLIPTDIDGLSVMELALYYELINFLEEPRIVRVANAMWSGGMDFLRPEVSFQEAQLDITAFYTKLWNQSGNFYFSPVGKFATSSTLYILYLVLFSYVTWTLTYDYTFDFLLPEIVLWISSAGYVANKIVEFVDEPTKYFTSLSNYWDVLIAIDWLILAYFRFINSPHVIYNSNGQLDEIQTRNTTTTEAYMFFWSLQCVLLWSRVVIFLRISHGTGPLILMVINMLSDISNFGLIAVLFLIGVTFGAYYIIGTDLSNVQNVRLGTLSSVCLYIFQTILGQQDWEKINSQKNDSGQYLFNPTRSNLVLTLMFFFSVFGAILLINLLIAMMANTFDSFKEKSNTELNKQRIQTTFELDQAKANAPPPLNVFSVVFFLYWTAFELIAWVLTFGHRQFNEEFVSPLNKELWQYNKSDQVTFIKGKEKIKGAVVTRKTCYERIKNKKALNSVPILPNAVKINVGADTSEQWDCIVNAKGVTYHVLDSEIVKVSKLAYKRRTARIPSLQIENKYCRFCRFNLTNDRLHIDYYLQLFEEQSIHIDPVDIQYMRDLLSTTDRFGVPSTKLCEMCPNCFRPFKIENGEPDIIRRNRYIFEIVSYLAFKVVVWPTLLIVLFIPANIALLSDFIVGRFVAEETEESKKQKSAMYKTEDSDEYRNKVREASKEEDDITEIVKKIDGHVERLELTLLKESKVDEVVPEKPEKPEKPTKDKTDKPAVVTRQDEFDIRVDKMRSEMNRRFEEIADILGIAVQRKSQPEPTVATTVNSKSERVFATKSAFGA